MKPRILLSGPNLTQDQGLVELLEEKLEVARLGEIQQLEESVKAHDIALVIMELSEAWKGDLMLMSTLKGNHPQLLFIVVNGGGQEAVIESFRFGASDFFKKPYNTKLLAERVEALIQTRIEP